MRVVTRLIVVAVATAFLAGAGSSALAQGQSTSRVPRGPSSQSIGQNDIQRLQDSVYEVNRSISRLRRNDPELASRLQEELDRVSEDVTYLKVKLRREGAVSQDEVADLRDRLDRLRGQAVGDAPNPGDSMGTSGAYPADGGYDVGRAGGQQAEAARPGEVPAGTELDVRLRTALNSGTSQVEDPFEATTAVDLDAGHQVLIPAGSAVRGVVASVDKAGRIERKGRVTLRIDRLTINHRTYPIRATVTQALESEGYRGDAAKIGAGAGVGAIIGGILGGVKGALAGVLIGGGGVVAATEGQDVDLPAGTLLRIRFEQPVQVR
jgi:hypothetical protein